MWVRFPLFAQCPHRLVVRTSPFHGGSRGSIPLGGTTDTGGYMKTGITCSTFDLLHAGHILMLEESKRNCDYLIACLQTNPTIDRPQKNKPVQTMFERYTQLRSVKYVDEIIVYDTEKDLENIFLSTHANIRFIGEDYKDKDFTAKNICLSRGIDIFYNARGHSFSTTELRGRLKS